MGIENFTVPIQKDEKELQEKTQQPSIESIMQTSKDLKAKIEEAKKQKEQNLDKKLTEREILLASLKSNEDLISETEKESEYFNSLSEEELNLLDETGKKELDNFKANLAALKEQSRTINERLNSMESNPEIVGKLHDQAVGEDNEIEAKKEEKREMEKFIQQIEQLAEDIKEYGELKSKHNITETKFYDSKRSIQELIDEARVKTDGDLRQNLSGIGPDYLSIEEMKKKLIELRANLGLFAKKDKATIDSILAGQKIFEEHENYKKEREDLKTEIQSKKDELFQRYKTIYSEIKSVQEKVDELKGSKTNYWESMQHKLFQKLKELIDEKDNIKNINLANTFKYDFEDRMN